MTDDTRRTAAARLRNLANWLTRKSADEYLSHLRAGVLATYAKDAAACRDGADALDRAWPVAEAQAEIARLRQECAEVETPAAGKRAQTPNEAEMLRALSGALTGGNASTWEQVLHAAERLRDESTLLNEWIPGDPVGMNEQPRHHPSLRDELAEIIRWRFCAAAGEIMDGVKMLKAAQEIADAIAPMIEEATGAR